MSFSSPEQQAENFTLIGGVLSLAGMVYSAQFNKSEFYRGEQVNTEMGNKIEGFQSCEKTEKTFLRDLDILNIKG